MNTALLGIAFDIILLILMLVTIVFAGRLSLSLQRFKKNRDIMDRMISDLNQNLKETDQVVEKMQINARQVGQNLQDTIDRAERLADELSLMTEAGNNLANRLDLLVDRTKPLTQAQNQAYDEMSQSQSSPARSSSNAASTKTAASSARQTEKQRSVAQDIFADQLKRVQKGPGQEREQEKSENRAEMGNVAADEGDDSYFSIRDRDVELGVNPLDNVDPLDQADEFQSEAERDLYAALTGKK
jgi:hypothetical protein